MLLRGGGDTKCVGNHTLCFFCPKSAENAFPPDNPWSPGVLIQMVLVWWPFLAVLTSRPSQNHLNLGHVGPEGRQKNTKKVYFESAPRPFGVLWNVFLARFTAMQGRLQAPKPVRNRPSWDHKDAKKTFLKRCFEANLGPLTCILNLFGAILVPQMAKPLSHHMWHGASERAKVREGYGLVDFQIIFK